jgi:signal peptide peptidase-like protein 2B
MVEVATGGGSGVSGGTGGNSGNSSGGDEQLPMVIRVPHLGYDPLSVCWQRYSLLGFGDILVPGMLVGFCHGFDLATANRRKLYYISTLIGEFLLFSLETGRNEKDLVGLCRFSFRLPSLGLFL